MGTIGLLAEGEIGAGSSTLYGVVGLVIGLVIGAVAVWLATKRPAAEPEEPVAPPKPSGAPLRLLALLQREGRLLDFLMEDVEGYSDAQIGTAVRDIHRTCRKALHDHLTFEPVLPDAEGSEVTVPAGFDPSAVRLTGNVTGQPPFRGTLRHHGWRVRDMRLAPPPSGQDEFVVQPAEVELV
ncbi:MAG TPA: DUF2760 domain-containing protein [Gemmataceae bacterium]|nr:DUF2760 domain-containing protein [Gemmataceae bacterium]